MVFPTVFLDNALLFCTYVQEFYFIGQLQIGLAWENSQHLAMLPLPNDVWETSAEITYWWRVTTQIWVVLLIGCTAWEIWFNQWYHLNQFKTKWPVQFCYLRLYLDIETVSCRLLPQRARMDINWKSWTNCFSSFNAMLTKITKQLLWLSAPW